MVALSQSIALPDIILSMTPKVDDPGTTLSTCVMADGELVLNCQLLACQMESWH